MPPLPAVAGVLQVAMTHSVGGISPVLTRFFVQYSGTAPTTAQLLTFATACDTAWGANLKSLMHTGVQLQSTHVIDLTSATGAVATFNNATSGTRAGTINPADVAVVDSYVIGRRYRGGHPRGYWPMGVVADLTNNHQWVNTFITAVNTGINAFFTAVVGAGWTGAGTLTHVNVSYFHGFTVVTNPITGRAHNRPTLRVTPLVDAVTATLARTSIGTQRRRLQYTE